MLLEVVALARDVGGDLDAVHEAHTGDLAEGGVRLLGGGGEDAGADAALLGVVLQSCVLGLGGNALAALADELGIPCCVNVAGTDSPVGWDAADPGNFSGEMYQRLVSSIRTIIDSANPKTAFYCLEPMPWMIPDSPDVTLQLMKDVDREQFAVHMDFVNMINCPRRFLDAEGFIEECFAKLGPYIKSTHLKDSRMDLMELTTVLHECSPGEGSLDFVRVLRIIDRYLPADAPVLLEHMSTFDEYRRAYDYVAAKAEVAGVGI